MVPICKHRWVQEYPEEMNDAHGIKLNKRYIKAGCFLTS